MAPFTAEMEEIVLARLAEGEALNAICKTEDVPVAESTVRLRVIDDPEFAARYARARDIGYDCRAERAVESAKEAGDPQTARLAFDAERWYLGKMKPKTYGEAMLHKHADAEGNTRVMDDTEKLTRIASILARAGPRDDSASD